MISKRLFMATRSHGYWRWGRDSNPRYLAVYPLSKRAHSATMRPHPVVAPLKRAHDTGLRFFFNQKSLRAETFIEFLIESLDFFVQSSKATCTHLDGEEDLFWSKPNALGK